MGVGCVTVNSTSSCFLGRWGQTHLLSYRVFLLQTRAALALGSIPLFVCFWGGGEGEKGLPHTCLSPRFCVYCMMYALGWSPRCSSVLPAAALLLFLRIAVVRGVGLCVRPSSAPFDRPFARSLARDAYVWGIKFVLYAVFAGICYVARGTVS